MNVGQRETKHALSPLLLNRTGMEEVAPDVFHVGRAETTPAATSVWIT